MSTIMAAYRGQLSRRSHTKCLPHAGGQSGPSVEWDLGFVPCPHRISMIAIGSMGPAADVIREHITHWSRDEAYNSTRLIKCQYCHTEFRINLKRFKYGISLFVTRWQGLGTGLSHLDYKWQSHIKGEVDARRRIPFEEGTILAAFEQGRRFEFDSLLRNEDRQELIRGRSQAAPSHNLYRVG
ncbi:hypothetical protein B0J14DRAFT_591877 [Halenospora varia]|nr:hypothetical protein B0J14DRAFT_591877 [Halenospora varia]